MTDLIAQAVVPRSITIPHGFCHCGCGQKTRISPRTNASRGYTKGQPIPFINGHTHGTRPVYESCPPFKIDGELCRIIWLTKGYFCIVNAEDYEHLWNYKWFAAIKDNGVYAARNALKGESPNIIYMHREIMKTPASEECDHRFHVTLDNRKSQMRNCPKSKNTYNVRMRRGNQSGYKGVTQDKRTGKYFSRIKARGVTEFIGSFHSAHKAAVAYDERAVVVHGELRLPQLPKRERRTECRVEYCLETIFAKHL
jgi:hypothetical protein